MGIYYITSDDDENITNLVDVVKSKSATILSVDTETTGLDCHTDKLILLQIKAGNEVYILNCRKLAKETVTNIVKSLVIYSPLLISHNSKFEVKFLFAHTGLLLTNTHDTMTTEVLINAGIGQSLYSLKHLVDKYCGVVLDKDVRQEFYNNPDAEITEQQIIYAANDVLYLEDIYNKQMAKVREFNEEKVYKLECDVLPVVAMMEYTGIYLNPEECKRLMKVAEEKREVVGEEILNTILNNAIKNVKYGNALEFAEALLITDGTKTKRDRKALESITDPQYVLEWAKKNFNLGSSFQLKTGLNLILKPKKIVLENTNEKTIEQYKNKHPIINTVFEYREYDKRITTYGQSFLDAINPVTNSVHTDYLDIGAATGRFSSTNPNMQNIPRESEYRGMFQARPGYTFISCDYNQQEYRLAGAITHEPAIISAYQAGKDMHTKTGALLNNVSLEEVTKTQRFDAKTVNFAMIYWTSVYGLRYTIKSTTEKAQWVYDTFTNGYPIFCAFRDMAAEKIWELGYSTTLLGRRRWNLPKPKFADSKEFLKFKQRVMREGFNHIIQGTGADITKMAMVKIFKENPFGEALRILLTIHDEVLVEVKDEIVKEATKFIEDCMMFVEQPFLGEIPAKVESHYGKVWTK